MSSRRIQPTPLEHQTSFDKAMRVRIAALVQNDHVDLPLQKTNPEITTSFEGRSAWWRLLYRSLGDNDMYDVFLNFQDEAFNTDEMYFDYLSFKRSDGNVPLHNFVLLLCGMYIGTRFWFAGDPTKYANDPPALAAIVLAAVTTAMLIATLFLRLSLVSLTYDLRVLQRFHPAAARFYKSRFGQCLDDGVVIGAALTMGLYIVSQAMAGACPPGTAMLNMQACDPVASDHEIAPEVMVLAVMVVVVFQMLARGVSRIGLLCAWVVAIVAINVSLWLVGSMSYAWINGELAYLLTLSYELERLPLHHFIKSVRVMEASEVNAQLKLALSKFLVRESEQALEAKRSMVRHVGHGTFPCSDLVFPFI
jgi:hypothetical protein